MDPLTLDPLTLQSKIEQARRDADRIRLQLEARQAANAAGSRHQAGAALGLSRSLRTFAATVFGARRASTDGLGRPVP